MLFRSEEEKEFLDFAEKKIDAIEPEAVLVREKEESIQSNSLEQIKNEKVELVRECDDDIINKALEDLPIKENVGEVEHKEAVLEKQDIKHEEVEIKQEIDEEKSEIIKNENIVKEERPKLKVNSLFANLGEENDTFTTYSIYIMREGDTLEKVMDKYKIKKEELEMYNDLSTIELNSKVVIPSNNNE